MPGILVVDDSPTIRLTLRQTIRNAAGSAIEIREAPDANKAISEFRVSPPEVVFLDMMLANGREGGLDVLLTMLKDNPSAKIILCTGLPHDHPDVVRGISEGAFAYLQKPIRLEAVKRLLEDLDMETGRTRRIK